VEAIQGWHRANDERGLAEERSRLSKQFSHYILDDLMPWHHHSWDFSLLEVNR